MTNRFRTSGGLATAALALSAAWIVVATLLVPPLIRSAYHGQSYSILNNLIRGQQRHPVEHYLSLWNHVWLAGLVLLAALSLAMVLLRPGRLVSGWKRYWFSPAPLGYLALCRIAATGLQLLLLLLNDVYNQNRLRELSRLPDSFYDPLPIMHLFLWPWGFDYRPSLEMALLVYWITVVAGLLALVGLRTNLNLLVFAGGNTFLQAFSYSFGDLHHPEALMIITLWILALSPCGRIWSLDRLWLGRLRSGDLEGRGRRSSHFREESSFAGWPLLLVQFLFALIYLDGAIRKLYTSGLDWMNGYTLRYYVLADALEMGSDFGVWLANQQLLCQMLSWTTIVFEGTFFLVLIVPRLVWIYLPLGIALHLGMCFSGVACFEQFLILYVAFLPRLAANRPPFLRAQAAAASTAPAPLGPA